MIRVLHVYSGDRFGGIETLLAHFARYRAEAPDIEPRFALCSDGPLARALLDAGCGPSLLGPARFRAPWTVWRARARLRTLLSGGRCDAVIFHELWAYALGAPAARSSGARAFLWHHNPSDGNWLERFPRRHPPDGVIACSRYVADRLGPWSPPGRARVCPGLVPAPAPDPGARARVRAELGASPGATVILHASRFSAYKGQRELLRAFARLGDLDARLWLAGAPCTPGEERFHAELRALAGELRLGDRLQLLGYRADAAALYAGADLYCQPNSGPEPYGLTFLEAMHAGLPVITTDFGGAAEIGAGGAALLLPPGDAEALVSALRRLVESPREREPYHQSGPARARELGSPARFFERLRAALA